MQRRHAYPVGTALGCCFITRTHEVDDEGIIDLDIDLETLPGWGLLCVSPTAVRALNEKLGWKLDTGDSTPTKQLKARIAELEDQNEQLHHALRRVMWTLVEAGITEPELVEDI